MALTDLEQNKNLLSIPEFSLDEYERPANNIVHILGTQNEDFDRDLLAAMFFGKKPTDHRRCGDLSIV